MSKKQSMVIIGAGCAGTAAAIGLRDRGWSGEIVLVGDEAGLPYERPPLSKASLAEETDLKLLVPFERLSELGISYKPGLRAAAIDTRAKVVQVTEGEPIAYHRLLLATGARPRQLTIPFNPECRTATLRTHLDAAAIREAIRQESEIVVIGGGFIGLEVAASAVFRGAAVTVLEAGSRILSRAVPEAMAEILWRRHTERGVRIVTGVQVERIEAGANGKSRVVLADGRAMWADVVIVGIGAIPNVELARDAGLRIDNGIWVDEMLRTSASDVFAAGDCCTFPNILYGRHIRLEAWRSAQRQGAAAAVNMLEGSRPYSDVPWFWSDQYDEILQIAGLIHDGDTAVLRDFGAKGRIMFYLNADHRLVAACGLGSLGTISKEIRFAEMLIERRSRPDPAILEDPTFNLKSLLA